LYAKLCCKQSRKLQLLLGLVCVIARQKCRQASCVLRGRARQQWIFEIHAIDQLAVIQKVAAVHIAAQHARQGGVIIRKPVAQRSGKHMHVIAAMLYQVRQRLTGQVFQHQQVFVAAKHFWHSNALAAQKLQGFSLLPGARANFVHGTVFQVHLIAL